MIDMTKAIEPKSDQLNFDDLIGGRTLTIKITEVKVSLSGEQRVSINFEGDNGKPYKPCKSMCRVLVNSWGNDSSKYVGKSLTLFGDPTVTWAGVNVGGIRISHMSHINESITMALTSSKSKRKPFTVKPLKVEQAKPAKPADPELIKKGNKASDGGVESYIKWKDSLNGEQKEQIRPHHKEWARNARAVSEKLAETVDGDGVITEPSEDETFPGDIPMPEGE